ncbi:hypothetical protein D915_001412 [Fasciola hepatica]|uniref:DNA/RNA-binding protein Alba-like domain-containing protein n=1 Tax=Fasciola hepatica TaxID=6192 RepID=A0A4E0RK06_FASHE|nr:hypothetical protein D915_001412 [Fasciola hepatica]
MDGEDLTMIVKPGSKIKNLLPFALKAFQAKTCRKVKWLSLQGATAKTVSCAEQFKQRCLPQSQVNMCSIREPSRHPDQVQELYQSSRIFLQRRDVTETAARIQYTLEEAAIEIVISKDPIAKDPSCQLVTRASDFVDFVPCATPTEDKSLGRRRLKHTKKRKREMPLNDPEKKSKLSKKKKSGKIYPEVVESTVPGSLSFPSPRLASGFEAATKSCETNSNNLTFDAQS